MKPAGRLAAQGLALILLAQGASAAAAGTVDRGRDVFRQCEACHSMLPGEHRFGPSLAGVIGRQAGSAKGYLYSDALAGARFRWDTARLAVWLSDDSKNMLPGTRMVFGGVRDPQDLRALLAYLASVSSGR